MWPVFPWIWIIVPLSNMRIFFFLVLLTIGKTTIFTCYLRVMYLVVHQWPIPYLLLEFSWECPCKWAVVLHGVHVWVSPRHSSFHSPQICTEDRLETPNWKIHCNGWMDGWMDVTMKRHGLRSAFWVTLLQSWGQTYVGTRCPEFRLILCTKDVLVFKVANITPSPHMWQPR